MRAMNLLFTWVVVGFLLMLGSAATNGAERAENTGQVGDATGSAFPGSVLGLTLLIDFEEEKKRVLLFGELLMRARLDLYTSKKGEKIESATRYSSGIIGI